MSDAGKRIAGPAERFLALCAAYIAGTWVIGILVGAPLDEALTLPFQMFAPLGLIALCFGALLIWILRRAGRDGPVAHVIGAGFVPFLTFVSMRALLGGREGLVGLFEAPVVLAVLTAGGLVAGLVLWSLRRMAGDLR